MTAERESGNNSSTVRSGPGRIIIHNSHYRSQLYQQLSSSIHNLLDK